MRSRVTLLLCLLTIALAVPALAGAQSGSPFTPLPQTPAPAPAPVTSAPADDDGGLETWQQVLIFLAGGILLAGIGWAIVKDAREAAPVEDTTEELAAARVQREADIRRRKQRARQANKRAKASRRRNR